jgi:hypothetical protein
MNNDIVIDGQIYKKAHTGNLNSPGGVAIRHQPDGELLAYLNVRYFTKDTLLKLISDIGTENFSVESIFSDPNHYSKVDNIPILTTEHPKAHNQLNKDNIKIK